MWMSRERSFGWLFKTAKRPEDGGVECFELDEKGRKVKMVAVRRPDVIMWCSCSFFLFFLFLPNNG